MVAEGNILRKHIDPVARAQWKSGQIYYLIVSRADFV